MLEAWPCQTDMQDTNHDLLAGNVAGGINPFTAAPAETSTMKLSSVDK